MKTSSTTIYPEEKIINKIYFIRDQKVMLDRDLAELYGVETKRLKEAVKRNRSRFPSDFMFEMSKEELQIWRTQFATSKKDRTGLRHLPFCFTEQGVTMLSCILNSERAIHINILIIRVFTRMRDFLSMNKDLEIKLLELENRINSNDLEIRAILDLIHKWLSINELPRNTIGFPIGTK